jgi:hypothetical protein
LFLFLKISPNFAKKWGKNRQIFDITKLEKKKKKKTPPLWQSRHRRKKQHGR